MRLTGAAGATLQARPTYQQTGTQPNGTSTASCVSLYMYDGNPGGYYTVGDPGNTYWYRIACPSGYSFSSNYTVGQDCNDGGGSGSCTGFYRNARSEEHTSELQSLMRISYAVFCLKQKKYTQRNNI